MATNWSIIAASAQMEQVKLEEFNLNGMKSTEDQSKTYVLIQSFIKQLTLFVKQCFFHACNKNNHPQLHPEAAIMLQFLRCLGNVTYGIFVYYRVIVIIRLLPIIIICGQIF